MAEKKFGDRTVRIDQVLATQAIILQARLMRAIGPALDRLPAIFSGRDKNATDAQKQASDAAAIGALAEVFSKARPEEIAELIKDIVEMGEITYSKATSYTRIDLDGDFSGPNMKDIMPVVAFILKETLGDFFSAALASGRRADKTPPA